MSEVVKIPSFLVFSFFPIDSILRKLGLFGRRFCWGVGSRWVAVGSEIGDDCGLF
jgi:hypothetical protein